MTLQNHDRESVISYRVDRARQTLIEIRDNALLGHWNLVANRLYYASYYACSALLLRHKLTPNSHAGLKRMVHLHFVKTGILTVKDGRLLSDLFNMRQTGDYDDIYDWTREEIEPMIECTEKFVDKIINLADSSKQWHAGGESR